MSIEFKCHKCGGKLRVADQHGGRHGRCPFCRKLLKVPAESEPVEHMVGEATEEITASILEEAAAESPAPLPDIGPEPEVVSAEPKPSKPAPKKSVAPVKKSPAPPAAMKGGKGAIKFECLLCGEQVSVGKEMAGKKVACPGCGESLTAPSA